MKASAGSGKTYTLAKKYIGLLLESKERDAYRHILAVTFTNKATEEMKSRILKELFIMATKPHESDYLDDFVPSVLPSVEELQRKSACVMSDILHDYSSFAISTIDKFFQQTLKAFAHEIGQFASYQVELDRDSVVEESVDRLLDSLTEEKKELRDWLTTNLLDQIERGGKYRVDASLMDIAKRLGSRQRKDALKEAGLKEDARDKSDLRKVRTASRKIIADGFEKLLKASEYVLSELGKYGLDVKADKRTFFGHFAVFAKLQKGEAVEMPGTKFLDKLVEPSQWFTAAQKKTYKPHIDLISSNISPYIDDVIEFFKVDNLMDYNTACILDSQLYGLGLAGELEQMFKEIMKEKNIMCLDDSNEILRDIINGSDAPFIYEKTGVRFDHFLLDEFQDTSRVQYDNFLPLLLESHSKGGRNLIVGDVKQSIYRWRGSDWNLLNSEIRGHFDKVEDDSLDTNWRSLADVIKFNNVLFWTLARVLDSESISSETVGKIKESLEDPKTEKKRGPMAEIYADVMQKVAPKHKEGGSVKVTFVPAPERGKGDNGLQKDRILATIEDLTSKGARLGDIAILVRGNAEGEKIAAFLLENNVSVITDESLKVKKSATVRRLMSLMSYVDNPADMVNGYLAEQLAIAAPSSYRSLIDLAEYFLRELKLKAGDGWKSEVPHIQSYMDAIQDYVSTRDNSLHNFLKYWEEKDPSISSPSSGDAVRIMTVHKSKGLAFPYVILPYAEKISFYKSGKMWCAPQLEGTSLEGVAEGTYDVMLSEASDLTHFRSHYNRESFLQLVDNMNILYVALTRAEKGMHIIASTPGKTRRENIDSGVYDFKNFAELIYWFVSSSKILEGIELTIEKNEEEEGKDSLTFVFGAGYDFTKMKRESDEMESFVQSEGNEFPSVPLNPAVPVLDQEDGEMVDVRELSRLKFSADSLDFFSEDKAGIEASPRLKGIVLHDILSRLTDVSELEASVDAAVMSGDVDLTQKEEIMTLLKERIESKPQWFESEGLTVMNETSLIDVDGKIYRPDRVMMAADGSVCIVDYKFGEHHRSYERQLKGYADIWKRMGYADVSAVLWYVNDDKIITVI